MNQISFQDAYVGPARHCYGCGPDNEQGLQIKSYWDGETSVCHFTPEPHHKAFPGIVYGGLIASLIDCHATGTASAAAYRHAGRELGSEPELRFVTGTLSVRYLAPTPHGPTLELRGHVEEIKGRKVTIRVDLSAGDTVCAQGHVVCFQVPDDFFEV